MPRTNPPKRSNATTKHSDIDNKRPRISDETGTTRSNEMVGSSSIVVPMLSPSGIETGINKENFVPIQATPPEFSLASPESPQRYQTQDEIDSSSGSDSDATTIFDPDGVKSGLPGLDSEDSEGSSWEEDDDDLNMILSKGVYADLTLGIIRSTGLCFPVDMVARLETIRLGVSNRGMLEVQSPTIELPSSRRAYVIIHAWEPTHCHGKSRAGEYKIIGAALSQDKANVEAMGYFYLKNPNHLRPSTRALRNCYQAPFTEVEDYHDTNDFGEFFEASGTRNCSAWGISERGCLALLAIHGLSGLDMVYVEEKELFV
ncbi:hypothetical protein K449DRAFT_381087 [Hypoxylon sp. EC38]|nr:hypothetical protein K449DRAFT_381087 [Hypoxylon sp. EC38]